MMIDTIRFPFSGRTTFNILWIADAHYDSKYCDLNKLKKDMTEAQYIIVSGDFFDVMEGYFDRRRSGKDERFKKTLYINDLIDETVLFLEPFKDKIIGWNKGNHELAFEKYSQIDLTAEIFKRLKIDVPRHGMQGYYVLSFHNKASKHSYSTVIFHTHNTGFGGRRSKGANAADILLGERPDADVIIGEHSHRGVIVPLKVEKVNKARKIKYITRYFVQGLMYKAADEDTKGMSFEIDKGRGLMPIGGININISILRRGANTSNTASDVEVKVSYT